MLNPIDALRQLVLPRSPAPRLRGAPPPFRGLLRRGEPGKEHHDRQEGGEAPSLDSALAPPVFPPPAGPAGAAPLADSPPPPPAPVAAPPPAALQELWPVLVRRVAWGGDVRRSCVRLELGAGALSGATVVLTYDEGQVRVSLDHPARTDLDAWRARIGARLLAAGLPVAEVE
ncbi:MAG: hypothetical protein ACRENE_21485 [Polyangiaceae bacterium]